MSGYKFPTGLIADNDGIYGGWLDQTLKKIFDIDVHHIPSKRPWENGRCEQFHLTIKAEILERVDILSAQHARELSFAYQIKRDSDRPTHGYENRGGIVDRAFKNELIIWRGSWGRRANAISNSS
jgi:hypothetical protein